MWIDIIMNLLLAIAIGGFLLITVFLVRALFQEKRSWEDIKQRARQSGIRGFTE
jgi:hypothetical protein